VTPRTTAHLEQLRGVVNGTVEPSPIAKLLGMTAIRADVGESVIELAAEPRHANPMGTLHGGVVCDVADLAMGTAFATTLEDDESFTTLDLTAKYLKPVWTQRLRAHARVTKRTRTLGLVECEVTDESGSLVAKVLSTCLVLRGDQAKGR
jgi:uncharacterized protein (TIGR00369 family)